MTFRDYLALFLILLLASAALAAPVDPGSVDSVGGPGWIAPTGDVVATDTRAISYTYTPLDPSLTFAGSNAVDGSLRSTVLRDPATQHLTFLYEFFRDIPGGGSEGKDLGVDGGSLSLSSFSGFTTDVTVKSGFSSLASRSADGAVITYELPDSGLGSLPTIAIATDATDFDSNGSAALSLVDEFSLIDAEGFPSLGGASSSLSLSNIYQPIAAAQPPPNVIPLPPAVWPGLLTLISTGAYLRLRRPCAG